MRAYKGGTIMAQLPDLTNKILLTPVCGNCGHELDMVYVRLLPTLHKEKELIIKHEYAVDPDQCPYCKTRFDSIRTKNIINVEE